jgi:predicted peptidase
MQHNFFLLMAAILATGADGAEPAPQTAASFASEVRLKVGYRYLLARPDPAAAAAPNGKWPLVVFLHGAGERGDNLEAVKNHGPPKLIETGRRFPAFVASPQAPAGERWDPHGVKALVDHLLATEPVDPDRVCLTGLSMGGFGTFDTVVEYPETFAAALPICGGAGANILRFERIRHLPLWIFHGARDNVVPAEMSRSAHERLQRIGGSVKLTIYPEAGHDSWTETYANPEVWDWLLAQRRRR